MSNHLINQPIWVVGAGAMAQAYANVLKALNKEFAVIGRGGSSAQTFYEATNIPVIEGGVQNAIDNAKTTPDYAIIATQVTAMPSICKALITWGVKHILIEKPAAITVEETNELVELVDNCNSEVYVAYNRRFYESVIQAKKIIHDDGGIMSFNFEFTEWPHVIKKLNYPKTVTNTWFMGNSTHVVDLAFYLGGEPIELSSYTTGSTEWYEKASTFAGAGITNQGASFSYQANWVGPGRWSVEYITAKHRLIFRPLEKLQIQELGTVAIKEVTINDELDTAYKPGIYRQTQYFLESENKQDMLTIQQQAERWTYYQQIEGVCKGV